MSKKLCLQKEFCIIQLYNYDEPGDLFREFSWFTTSIQRLKNDIPELFFVIFHP